VKIIFKAAALILVSTVATAQTTPAKPKATTPAKAAGAPSTPAQTAPAAAAPNVAATDTVITVPGLCPPNTPPESCSTKISRADFEQVISVVNPNLPKEQRRQVATLYVQLLSAANEGKKLGVDKDPLFQEQRRLEDLKMLAQAAEKKMFENNKPTQQDVESFYTENTDKFEELSLRRIMIPKATDKDAKPEQAKQLADKIHERAVAGEDPDKLEADAYLATKAPGAPPSTSLGWKRPGAMDPRHEPQIVALKSGQVSEVLEDGQGYYIYKVDSKRMVPLATVAKDIENVLQTQRTQQTAKQIFDRTKPQLSDAYFGPAETAKPEPPAAKAPAPK
jgi:parvulin-like peptidyl-prolyl isomerase